MRISSLLGVVVGLAACGCASPASEPQESSSDGVAFLVDRNFGTWMSHDFPKDGTSVGGMGREPSPRLRTAGTYRIRLDLVDGRTFEVSRHFVDGTSIPDVTDALALALKQAGLSVVAVPEFGAFRVQLPSQLREMVISGGGGFTVEPTRDSMATPH